MIDIEFTGIDRALMRMSQIEKGISDQALKVGARKASNYLAQTIRVNTPVGREGALRQSIGSIPLKAVALPPGAEVGFKVGPVRKAREKTRGGMVRLLGQFYKAWFLEFGTEPHSIQAGAKRLRVGNRFYGQVDVEGIKARDFIGAAQRQAFPEMEAIFAREVNKFLDRVHGTG